MCVCVCVSVCVCVLIACPCLSATGFSLLVHLLLLLSLRLLLLIQERSVWFQRWWDRKRAGHWQLSQSPDEERGPVMRMAWLPSSIRHLLPLRVWLSPKEGVGGMLGLNCKDELRGSGESFSYNPSPPPGYLSLSKVVPFSHYAGTLLLLLAGVACLRGRWRGRPVWIYPSLSKYSLGTFANTVWCWALKGSN